MLTARLSLKILSDFWVLVGCCLLLAEGIVGFWLLIYPNSSWNKQQEISRPKKLTERKRIQVENKSARKRKEKLATVFTILGVAAGFGSWGYSVLAPNPSVAFGSILLMFGVACCGIALWEYFEWDTKFKASVLAVAVMALERR